MNKGFQIRKLIIETIEFPLDFCYTVFTLPPIFRDGVRGGSAASAVLMGGII